MSGEEVGVDIKPLPVHQQGDLLPQAAPGSCARAMAPMTARGVDEPPRGLPISDASLVIGARGGGAVGGVWQSLPLPYADTASVGVGRARGRRLFLVPRHMITGMGLRMGQALGRRLSVGASVASTGVGLAVGVVRNGAALGLAWRRARLCWLRLYVRRIRTFRGRGVGTSRSALLGSSFVATDGHSYSLP